MYEDKIGLVRSRTFWLVLLLCVVALGILSRIAHTGYILVDKYLGDALYAAMVYALLRLWIRSAGVTIPAFVLMVCIELFQLTGIPAAMYASEQLLVRICGRLLGTSFSIFDLFAYAVGIGAMHVLDVRRSRSTRHAGI